MHTAGWRYTDAAPQELSSLPPLFLLDTLPHAHLLLRQSDPNLFGNMSSNLNPGINGHASQGEPNNTVPNLHTHPGIKSQVMGGFTLSSQDLQDVNAGSTASNHAQPHEGSQDHGQAANTVPNVHTHPGIKSQVMGGFTLSAQDLKDVNGSS